MQITAQQAAEMTRASADGFNARALEFLKRKFPDIAARTDDERFMRFVEHGRARAELHGFVSERDIVQYMLVMMHLGPRFDEDPRRAPVLAPFLDAGSLMSTQMRLDVLLDAAAAEESRARESRHAGH